MTATLALTAALSAPFVIISTSNYFHKDGFIDKVGSFSSVLTGFYVAGLLAVATFSASMGNLDGIIQSGRIILPSRGPTEPARDLTRREYVCAIFGYLSALSLFTTLISITIVTIAEALPALHDWHLQRSSYKITIYKDSLRVIPIFLFSALVSHLTVVTCHGLYYLMDRLYAQTPEILPENEHNLPE